MREVPLPADPPLYLHLCDQKQQPVIRAQTPIFGGQSPIYPLRLLQSVHCQGLRRGLVAETVQELNFTRINHNLPLGPSPLKLQSFNRLQISKIVISFRSCQSDSAGGETDCCFPLCPLSSIPPKLGAFGRGRGGGARHQAQEHKDNRVSRRQQLRLGAAGLGASKPVQPLW